MQLPETTRQIVAGAAASGAFLGAFFGLHLVWWMALIAGVAVYGAMMLIIGRRPPPTEEYVADGVSRAELTAAINSITAASSTMRGLSQKARGADREAFSRMAKLFEAIRGHHIKDPRDYRHTRRFIRHDLPRIVESAEKYVDLDHRASGTNRDRVEALGQQIHSFLPVLEKIDQACLENDFMALEVQVEVLGEQLETR